MTPLEKLYNYVGDLGKLIVAKGPKSNKSPNLVTLIVAIFYSNIWSHCLMADFKHKPDSTFC